MKKPINAEDRLVLESLLTAAENGLVVLEDLEVEALERIREFLKRPTAQEIDAIVASQNLRQDEVHAVERTVRALWGT